MTIIVLVGALLVWFYGLQLALWIYCLFFRNRKGKGDNLEKYKDTDTDTGSWAIVTGATAGIGLAFCEELLEKGWNVFLISRSADKLKIIKQALQSQFPQRQLQTLHWEASEIEESQGFQDKMAALKEELEGKDVGLLVNNVGTTESTFGWFSEVGNDMSEAEHVADLVKTIKTNCVFPSKLTAALIPLLKSRANNTPSAIINISSILAHLPSPFNPIYGATKAYNRTFSRALTAEYAQQGIDVICVSPGMVTSNLTGMKESTWFCASSKDTAKYSLKALGFAVEVFPHPIHGLTFLLTSLLNLLPQKIVTTGTALALRFLPKPPGINVSRDFRKY